MGNPLGRVEHAEIPSRGFFQKPGKDEKSNPPIGSLVQLLGTRETFVADGKGHWLSQNDNLGAKLDAIQAAAEAQLSEQRITNQFLEVIAEALHGGN